ncbi:uncharacterized protein LOC125261319 [Megalobrama amblycephala]|uniref:uncharacterized protein LOC125261319 n=1 Tax=Megalobrama amblycephala TaxID=75352 RepID=UPI002013DB8F|nr:uncharacterized protein LOC125261319 [Megalobrama amblycephala]
MMESVLCEYLLDALDDINTEELMKFKWYLKNSYHVQSSDLEKAKHSTDTVDLMKKHFGPERAVKITVDILRKIKQNHLAEQLEKKHKQAQAEGSIKGPDPAGVSSELKKKEAEGSIEGPDPAGASSEPMKGKGSQLSTCPDPRALPPSLAGLGLNESEEWKRDDEELLRNRGTDPRTRNDFLKLEYLLERIGEISPTTDAEVNNEAIARRPTLNIPAETIETYLMRGVKAAEITRLFGVSEMTLRCRMHEYGIRMLL